MDAERLMRFTVVLVVLALVALIVTHETAPSAPTPEPVARVDWIDDEEESVIEIGVPPEPMRPSTQYLDLEYEESIPDPKYGPPFLEATDSPGGEFTREDLERARSEGRAAARLAAELGNPTLMAGGYRAIGYAPMSPGTGLPIGTIGDDLDPYQIAFVDAYNREIHRLFGSRVPDGPREDPFADFERARAELRKLIEATRKQSKRIDELETELGKRAEQRDRLYVDRLAEGETFDGRVKYTNFEVVIVDLDRGDKFLEGTVLMVWKGSKRIALLRALPNSRVCQTIREFAYAEVEEGMRVSSPFFERGRSLAVAIENPEETTDIPAIRDRLMMLGARFVTTAEDADVVIRINGDLTPVPGKLVVGPKALYTFLNLRP